MTPYQQRLTPAVRRLVGDMKIRRLAQATIDAYTYHVQRFADFVNKPLDRTTVEDVRNFQLHLVEQRQVGFSSFNQAVCALRFLYTTTIPRKWPIRMIPFAKRPKNLPTVLSHQEVEQLLACTASLKQRTFLMTLYSAGLRLSEAAHLRLEDIDSQRMQLRVTRGKRVEATTRATLAATVGPVAGVLESVSPSELSVPWQDSRHAVRRDLDSKGHQSLGPESRDQKERLSACVKTFVRDRVIGIGRGHLDDQPLVGSRQFRDDDDLLARPPHALGQRAESVGHATGSPASWLATSEHEPAAELTQAEPAHSKQFRKCRARWRSCRCVVRRRWANGRIAVRPATNGCVVYNSCGDRHCPTCSGAKRADWMESASELILEGMSYYQVVFTLPNQLSRLALGNRREIYDLLFRASWSALQTQITQEQGYDPAALMVLHTWNQKLESPRSRPRGGSGSWTGRGRHRVASQQAGRRREFGRPLLSERRRVASSVPRVLRTRLRAIDEARQVEAGRRILRLANSGRSREVVAGVACSHVGRLYRTATERRVSRRDGLEILGSLSDGRADFGRTRLIG